MITLKPLSKDHIPAALKKAERYRLLNEPTDAESICLDVLAVDPQNQEALITLLLAITDQYDDHGSVDTKHAIDVLQKINGEYEQQYYQGLIFERKAKAILHHALPGYKSRAAVALQEAMKHFEDADTLSLEENDDAVLRWNACARIINEQHLESVHEHLPDHYVE
jgi:hypothetical protein